MSWTDWVAVVALLVGVLNVYYLVRLRADVEELRHKVVAMVASDEAEIEVQQRPLRGSGPVVVIYNPSKEADFDDLKRAMAQAAADAGLGVPIWMATSAQEPGTTQTRAAIEMNASVVVAAGGDGTVRLVAGELGGRGIPLGLIPIGTGNLLARNLGLPLDSMHNLASIAITGRSRRIDLGRISAPKASAELLEEIANINPDAKAFEGEVPFVVIAGLGFDAQVMQDADDNLKRVLGWSAYVVSGVKHLNNERVAATITTGDGGNEIEVEARSIMFANCGGLPGGLMLAPDARIDDGWLDIAVLNTKGGILGWGDLARRIGLARYGVRDKVLPEVGSIDFRRTRSAEVLAQSPEQVQADGDPLGYARDIRARVEKGALLVRVA